MEPKVVSLLSGTCCITPQQEEHLHDKIHEGVVQFLDYWRSWRESTQKVTDAEMGAKELTLWGGPIPCSTLNSCDNIFGHEWRLPLFGQWDEFPEMSIITKFQVCCEDSPFERYYEGESIVRLLAKSPRLEEVNLALGDRSAVHYHCFDEKKDADLHQLVDAYARARQDRRDRLGEALGKLAERPNNIEVFTLGMNNQRSEIPDKKSQPNLITPRLAYGPLRKGIRIFSHQLQELYQMERTVDEFTANRKIPKARSPWNLLTKFTFPLRALLLGSKLTTNARRAKETGLINKYTDKNIEVSRGQEYKGEIWRGLCLRIYEITTTPHRSLLLHGELSEAVNWEHAIEYSELEGHDEKGNETQAVNEGNSQPSPKIKIPKILAHQILNPDLALQLKLLMGLTRDTRHKRSASGAKRAFYRKKRAFEKARQEANTRIGPKRVHVVRTRGGNHKYRALRIDNGNFAWGSEGCTRKTRVISVVFHPSNNELVRTNTLTKSAVIQVDAAPFRQWYEAHYGQQLGRRRQQKVAQQQGKEIEELAKGSNSVQKKHEARAKTAKVEGALEKQFEAGRLYAVVSSRPGQSGRCDGYILEGEELAFYQRKLHK
ncbi:40S ribosomal protein S8-B [Zalerion maritima]|uniref:40S ribosomal protein S8 n=1 Tax=Zalerion maritima TaxID=339359 RepID=A0AAD5WXU1_9PEZI|nr:40S ribosomal protein S8-B [Zalerion maritima]